MELIARMYHTIQKNKIWLKNKLVISHLKVWQVYWRLLNTNVRRQNLLWFPGPLLFPEICWAGETSVCSQATAFPRATAHSTFLVLDCWLFDCPHSFRCVFCFSLMPWIKRFFFVWHFWFPVGLKRFAFLLLMKLLERHEEWPPVQVPMQEEQEVFSRSRWLSTALILWPLHFSAAVFNFSPLHFRWHWFHPKCYTLKQECHAAPDRHFCLQSPVLPL